MKYKLRTKISFIDKYNTDKVYAIGEEIECDEKRGEELLSNKEDLVELIEKPEEETPKKTTHRKTTKKTGTAE